MKHMCFINTPKFCQYVGKSPWWYDIWLLHSGRAAQDHIIIRELGNLTQFSTVLTHKALQYSVALEHSSKRHRMNQSQSHRDHLSRSHVQKDHSAADHGPTYTITATCWGFATNSQTQKNLLDSNLGLSISYAYFSYWLRLPHKQYLLFSYIFCMHNKHYDKHIMHYLF